MNTMPTSSAVLPSGLGGFGAITSVTLDVVPAFSMQQEIYAGIAFPDLYANFEEIMASALQCLPVYRLVSRNRLTSAHQARTDRRQGHQRTE